MSERAGKFLLWLEWPEACFRATAADEEYLRTLVPSSLEVKRVRSEEEFVASLPEATHVLTWHFKKEWYGLSRRLGLVATPAAGRELVAWREAPAGVAVHFGGFHGEIMAESVAAFCLAWARGFFRPPPPSGLWPRTWLADKCFSLAGTRAAILGYGKVGRAVGRKLSSLGVSVQGFSRANFAELPDALAYADWLVLALPGDTGTDDILDASLLACLPPRAAVVNIGRGNAIDEHALADALASGKIAAAYLDVFKDEPTQLNPGSPSRQGILANPPPNLIAMPHSSAFSPGYVRAAIKELKDDGCI